MPWVNDEFKYSKWLLKKIALSYQHICDRIVLDSYTVILDGHPVEEERRIRGPFHLAEYKADFDQALSAIGKEKWQGITGDKLSDYKRFNKLQLSIIADILGNDDPMEPQMRGYAYRAMANYLNGLPLWNLPLVKHKTY